MKLVAIAKKKDMLAFDIEGNGQKVWTYCSPAVLGFVKKTMKEGDNVTPTFDGERDGMKYIVKVVKGSQTTTEPKTSNEPKCIDCGKVLQDSKYKKCWACNQKNPTPKQTSSVATSKDELIKREAVAHAASRVLISLQGQVDINNVHEVYNSVYETILKLVENK